VLALLCLAAAAAAAGCGGLGNIKVFEVSIVNDTASPVVVRDCADFCSSSPLTFNLAPGESTPLNRVAGEHKYFSVTTPSGRHVGCVDLHFSTPSPGATVPVSSAGRCPGTSGPPRGVIGLCVLLALTLAVIIFRRRRRD
jgi:hypothetical protein